MELLKIFVAIHHDLLIAKLARMVFHGMLFSTWEAIQQIDKKELSK